MSRAIAVEIVGDSRSLERAFARSTKAAGKFNRDVTRLRGTVSGSGLFRGLASQVALAGGAFLGATGFVAGIKAAIEGASDLQEQMGKTEIVFGKSGQAILDWSKTTATAFGISQQEALATASSFGALLRPAGFGVSQAAEQSRRLTELGSDLAAFYNTDVTDALQALQSGVVGQARPLRRYGVLLSATRANLVALAQTGKKTATTLTDQEKVAARLAIIYHDTALAQGNFALTSGNLAQQQKQLMANLSNIRDELGQALLPIVLRLVLAFNRWIGNTQNQHKVMEAFAGALQRIGQVAVTVYNILRRVIDALGGVGNTLTVLVGAWVGFRIAAIGSTIAVTTANIIAARVVQRTWQAALISTGWGAFAVAAGIAAAYVVTHWEDVKVKLQLIWIDLQTAAYKAARGIAQAFTHLPGFAGGDFFRKRVEALTNAIRELSFEAGFLKSRAIIEANKRQKEAEKGLKLPKIPPLPPLPKFPKAPGAPGPTAEDLRNRKIEALQLAVDQAEATKGLLDDIRALKRLQGFLKEQIRLHKGNLDLRRQLLSVNNQIADVLKQQREQTAAAQQAAQFRLLGLGPTGEAPIPGVKALRRRLARAREEILGTFLDTRKERGLLARIRKILSGQLGAVGEDVRRAIEQILANIDRQLKSHQQAGTKFRHITNAALLAGLGLTPAQRKALQVRLATVGPGGSVPTPSGQFAGAGATGIHINTVHVHGVQDVKAMENALAKRARQRAHPRRSAR